MHQTRSRIIGKDHERSKVPVGLRGMERETATAWWPAAHSLALCLHVAATWSHGPPVLPVSLLLFPCCLHHGVCVAGDQAHCCPSHVPRPWDSGRHEAAVPTKQRWHPVVDLTYETRDAGSFAWIIPGPVLFCCKKSATCITETWENSYTLHTAKYIFLIL